MIGKLTGSLPLPPPLSSHLSFLSRLHSLPFLPSSLLPPSFPTFTPLLLPLSLSCVVNLTDTLNETLSRIVTVPHVNNLLITVPQSWNSLNSWKVNCNHAVAFLTDSSSVWSGFYIGSPLKKGREIGNLCKKSC